MRGAILVALLLVAAHGRCENHIQDPRFVYVTGVCEQGLTELVWAEGLGRTPVELHDCVLLPEVFALRARTCCGDVCSGIATECIDSEQGCQPCNRMLDHRGGLLLNLP